jgi:hypothetical protein
LTATYKLTIHSGADSGYRADVVVTNSASLPVTGFELIFTLLPGQTVIKVDGAVYVQDGTVVTMQAKNMAQILRPGQKVAVHVEVRGSVDGPTGCTISGSPCG